MKLNLRDRSEQFLLGQSLALLAGSIIGWREVIWDIQTFCQNEGYGIRSLTSFSGNLTTNPILTPCFWGSIAFVVALVWSVLILYKKVDRKQENKLIWLLIGSTIFAWANTGYTFYKYISKESGTDFFGCPADKIDNPFTTACFMGASAFLVSLIFGWLYLRSLKNSD